MRHPRCPASRHAGSRADTLGPQPLHRRRDGLGGGKPAGTAVVATPSAAGVVDADACRAETTPNELGGHRFLKLAQPGPLAEVLGDLGVVGERHRNEKPRAEVGVNAVARLIPRAGAAAAGEFALGAGGTTPSASPVRHHVRRGPLLPMLGAADLDDSGAPARGTSAAAIPAAPDIEAAVR